MISGQFATFGLRIQITANLQDLPNQQTTSVQETAENQTVLLETIEQLAAALREKLALAPDVLKAVAAASYRPSSKSLRGAAAVQRRTGAAFARASCSTP